MKRRNERGAMIVEASIVFPVMFLVIFFMIFTGNAYLQKCRVEAIVNEYAIDGAAYCADPQLQTVEGGSLPSLSSQIYPYRNFGTSNAGFASGVAGDIEGKIYSKVNKMSTGLFSGMKPVMNKSDISAKYSGNFLYSTFCVDAAYKIKIPVRLLFEKENMYLKVSTHVEMPVSGTVEMIRNIDMIWDYMERAGLAEKIGEAKAKLNEALDKVNAWFGS